MKISAVEFILYKIMKLTACILLFVTTETVLASEDPTTHKNWHLLDHDNCGESTTDRIIGGTMARMGQFPWMVRIGYVNPKRPHATKRNFHCGGTIINRRYVLTAAHCVHQQHLGSYKLGTIRIGEYNVNTEIDCEDSVCMPPVQDFLPEKTMYHKKFHPDLFHYDIALIRLDRPIKYNTYVSPICLPYGELLRSTPERLTVAGWGMTNPNIKRSADYLLYVVVPLTNLTKCAKYLGKEYINNEGQLCAGGQKGQDSCGGDSGGPLKTMSSADGPPKMFQFGLVSFGHSDCGSLAPAVYTDVRYHLTWILDRLES